ncbi:hypothetical protein ACHHYP_11335 [Achlya hypogyna]|uniref:Protein kinase domain-containing protein n=1 Tax=Achlya hypogyna TaxID=1202772 RepID=A0A1V9YJG3_ACHHY|nr:hypothetical protein ACHHYP_11335 [Achlya hypogyna]
MICDPFCVMPFSFPTTDGKMVELVLQGNREFVDAARATALLAPYEASTSFYRISLRDKSYSLEASHVLAAFLKTIPHGLRVADLADMIAGRPEDEALLVLENVCQALRGHQLLEIDLSDNALGSKGVRACYGVLLEQQHLERLFLCNNGLSADSAQVIADVLLFRGKDVPTKLKTFHFYNNMSGDGGAKALATLLPHCPELEDLRFSTTRSQREGCRVFAAALGSLRNLKRVDLSDNTFGDEGATVLAAGLGLQAQLEVLNLRDASIGDDGFIAIADALVANGVNGIRVLDVSGNDLTEASMAALGRLVKALPLLEELRIEENEIGSAGATTLARALHAASVGRHLRVFQSNTNEIASVGGAYLAAALVAKPALGRVELDGNMFSDDAVAKLEAAFGDRLVEMEDNMDDDDEADEDLNDVDFSDDEEVPAADVDAVTVALAATSLATEATLAFDAKREVVDAARAEALLAPFRGQSQFHTISLRGKSYTLDGARVMASYLSTLKGLQVADLADIIAGRPEEEALEVLSVVCEALKGHVLDTIDLSDNALGEKGVRACFAILIPQPRLKHLLFENNGISAAAAAVIAKEVVLQTPVATLETFSFFNNMSGHDGCLAIANMLPGCPHLKTLRYASARAGIEASTALAVAIGSHLTELESLDLSDCSFDDAGVVALTAALRKQRKLKVLKLRDASLGPEGAVAVVKALDGVRLTSLDLSGNELEDEGMGNLANGPHSLEAQTELKVLRLDENECTSAGLAVFADEIRACLLQLEELSLCGNEITASGAISLVKTGLQTKAQLTRLHLDANMISAVGLAKLKELLSAVGKSHVLGPMDENDDEAESSDDDDLKTGEVVAIKRLKTLFPTWEECLQLRELRSLKVLRHDNIIQLKEVIRDKAQLYFVFEYMDTSLFLWMRANGPCTNESHVRTIMNQLFAGLAYMHKHGFFHRDIKPENCLLSGDKNLKIADLGQAREIRSRPPFTDYVSTRWYRSPELLLRAAAYNSPIDLWACGCIMAELFLGKPLFAGTSEADQMCRICSVLGTPTKESWPEGVSMVAHMQFKFPKCPSVPLKQLIPNASPAAIQLMVDLLQYDSARRPTAAQALQYRFFSPTTARAEPPKEPAKVPSPEKAETKRHFWEPKIDDEWKYIPQPEKTSPKARKPAATVDAGPP